MKIAIKIKFANKNIFYFIKYKIKKGINQNINNNL